MKRSLQFRKVGLEQLESRRVFAGNVTAQVIGGDLFITGDNNSNGVQIFQVMQQGQPILGRYLIAGVATGGAATTINGLASDTVVAVTDDVEIRMNGGNDVVTTNNLVNLLVADDLNVDLGEGNNRVRLDRVRVDDLNVNSGAGNDNVFFRGTVGALPGSVDNDLTIRTGRGVDQVFLQNFFVRDDLFIDGGSGEFSDLVTLFTGNVGDDVTVFTGEARDVVNVIGVGVNDDLRINTGSGRDSVLIQNSEADELFADLGSGDDRLDLVDTFGRRAEVDGESGLDTLLRSNFTFTEGVDDDDFEIFL